VICSATQEGLRNLRSKEEIRACRVARSDTGPGNPYWNNPAGSTGGIISLAGIGTVFGIGAGTDVVDVADTDVEEDMAWAWAFFSERVEYIAAVTPAPVAADTAAMIAIVAFDILERGCHRAGIGGWYIFGFEEDGGKRRG
jgi:hypothetical protein